MRKFILASYLGVMMAGCSTQTTKPIIKKPLSILSPSQLDSDKDGITDDKDQCLNTPLNVKVDEIGCPKAIIDTRYFTLESRLFYPPNQVNIPTNYRLTPLNEPSNYLTNLQKLIPVWKNHIDYAHTQGFIIATASQSEGKNETDRMQLSKQRALVVKNFLKSNGIDRPILALACGTSMPIGSDNDDESQLMNRRTYLKIDNDLSTYLDIINPVTGKLIGKYQHCEWADVTHNSQHDSDNDGVTDDKDQCPYTHDMYAVLKNGCVATNL